MKNAQMTRKLSSVYGNEIRIIIKDLGLEGLRFGFELDKPRDPESFSELVIVPGIGYKFKFNWNAVPRHFNQATKLIMGLFEMLYDLRLVWQIETGSLEGCSGKELIDKQATQEEHQRRFDDALNYVEEAMERLAREYPESRFSDLAE